MKYSANLVPVIVSAAVALVASLAVLFTNDLLTLLYSVGVTLLGIFALLLWLALRKGRRHRIIALAVFGTFLAVTAAVVANQHQIRPHLLWLVWSGQYKSQVFADSSAFNGEFKHVEWDGDGWGSGATGDWMGYIVFDPSDSLSSATTSSVPTRHKGIPCGVISVRRLERQWYSVVLDMNKFWDKSHPGC
jgi:uncharacterized membrane protein